MVDRRETYIDKAGRRMHTTALQDKILYYRLDHPEATIAVVCAEVGCSPTAVWKTASNPLCIKRVAEIREMVDKAHALGYAEKRRILAEVARADITQFVGKDGVVELTADNPSKRAVQEYDAEKGKIKLLSRLDAIDLDNRMEQLYKTDTQININNAVIIKEVEVRLSDAERC